jgi:hypothetical protein
MFVNVDFVVDSMTEVMAFVVPGSLCSSESTQAHIHHLVEHAFFKLLDWVELANEQKPHSLCRDHHTTPQKVCKIKLA